MTDTTVLQPMPETESPRWSSTDPAHWCLRDRVRTEALMTAITRAVRPGDTVVEAGAGSGILSVTAAVAGAGQVIAIELDPDLAYWLPLTAAANGVSDQITVVTGDAHTVDLPQSVDVVIAELIDTGLIDERQVPVLNAFHARGVIGPRTRLIPERYTTWVELVEVDDRYYGHRITAPVHDWPVFQHAAHGWHPVSVRPLTAPVEAAAVDFSHPAAPRVDRLLEAVVTASGTVNGLRITGSAHLGPGLDLGATNAINGDKILRLEVPIRVRASERIAGRLGYVMGGGLGSVRWTWED